MSAQIQLISEDAENTLQLVDYLIDPRSIEAKNGQHDRGYEFCGRSNHKYWKKDRILRWCKDSFQ